MNKRAGGKAVESGQQFHGRVATWFAVKMLTGAPIGTEFGLHKDRTVVSIQLETSEGLDDVLVSLDDGSIIDVQSKNTAGLEKREDSPLGKTLRQVAARYSNEKTHPVSRSWSAVLAVSEATPRSILSLEKGCRLFDLGGDWNTTLSAQSKQVREALQLLEAHVCSPPKTSAPPIASSELPAIARAFRVKVFPDAQSSGWTELARELGSAIYGGAHHGEDPLKEILALCRSTIATGAPMDRRGVLVALRNSGHIDTAAPRFEQDIARLKQITTNEHARLRRHTALPIDGGIRINRECLQPLNAAVAQGSIFLTGEPGAGKTATLIQLHEQHTGPAILLSIDNLAGVTSKHALRNELNLQHDLVDVLDSWPGKATGLLILDAFDASRGGASESVFLQLIEEALLRLPGWRVVVSIRIFDLRSGRRLKRLLTGVPPNPAFASQGLEKVRHFQIPRLSDSEFQQLEAQSPRMKLLVDNAPDPLKELLRNAFSLSLAADLIDTGTLPQALRTTTTQAELLYRYEESRIDSQLLGVATKSVVREMIEQSQLLVRATDIEVQGVDELCRRGVLSVVGDKVAFAHHVLFDHVASRFFLHADNADALFDDVAQTERAGFLLGPAMTFALETLWEADASREQSWRVFGRLLKSSTVSPVARSAVLRSLMEHVKTETDVNGLLTILGSKVTGADWSVLGELVRLVSYAAPTLGEDEAVWTAWSRVAREASRGDNIYWLDAAHILLMSVPEAIRSERTRKVFGEAARSLLTTLWSQPNSPVPLVVTGIKTVAHSYDTNPTDSRTLLSRILNERFESHAALECYWLTNEIRHICRHDPEFAVAIYRVIFERTITNTEPTPLGGSISRMLPMTSTPKQDFDMARYHLTEAAGDFLRLNASAGTRAIIVAIRGIVAETETRHRQRARSPTRAIVNGQQIEIVDDSLSYQGWNHHSHSDGPLEAFTNFLRECSPSDFHAAIAQALATTTSAAVWARLLGVASERTDVQVPVLWEVASTRSFLRLFGLIQAAVAYIATTYDSLTFEQRAIFEDSLFADGHDDLIARRVVSSLNESVLIRERSRSLRAQLQEENRLSSNRPLLQITTGPSESPDTIENDWRYQNIDIGKDANIRIIQLERDARLPRDTAQLSFAATADLWKRAAALNEALLDAQGASADEPVQHSGWATLSEALEKLADSENFVLGENGAPTLSEFLAVLSRAIQSPYPTVQEMSDADDMGWTDMDVRVHAAGAITGLILEHGSQSPELIDWSERLLRDIVPAVRYQIARALLRLWNIDRERMWQLAEFVASNETHPRVLASYVHDVLHPLRSQDSTRTASLVERLLKNAPRLSSTKSPRILDESIATLVGRLAIIDGQPFATQQLEEWTEHLSTGAVHLEHVLQDLRQLFFWSCVYDDDARKQAIGARAFVTLTSIVDGAISELRTPNVTPNIPSPTKAAAAGLLQEVCARLYFGSGAYERQKDDEAGLPTTESKQAFLNQYWPLLERIADNVQPQGLHYLFEILEFAAESAPDVGFDHIARLLLGPGKAIGYQFETLTGTWLAKFVRRCLADYRAIFGDSKRRQVLVEVLDVFGKAGWKEAILLLYELPEMLR